MKLLTALLISFAFAAASNANADSTYKCQSFGSSDSVELQLNDLTAMLTTAFDGMHMGSGNNGTYQFQEPMVIGQSAFMQATLSVPMGTIGSQYLYATVTDGGNMGNSEDLDCTLQ